MAATAAQIARLRRMVNEPTSTTYSDTTLAGFIEEHPTLDANGREQYLVQAYGTVAAVANPLWVPSYDLAAAAADVWEEKAAVLAGDFDFAADGASYTRSQAYEQYMKQARHWRSRRMPSTMRAHVYPRSDVGDGYIGNLPEIDD